MAFEPNSPAAMLFLTTVRIETVERDENGDDARYIATGFLVESKRGAAYLVTCRHVVEHASRGSLVFRPAHKRAPVYGNAEVSFDVTDLSSYWRCHPDPDVDVAVTPMDTLLREIAAPGLPPYLVPLPATMIPTPSQLEDLDALEEVAFVGYPRGLWDQRNGFPILRRGITASPLYPWTLMGQKSF